MRGTARNRKVLRRPSQIGIHRIHVMFWNVPMAGPVFYLGRLNLRGTLLRRRISAHLTSDQNLQLPTTSQFADTTSLWSSSTLRHTHRYRFDLPPSHLLDRGHFRGTTPANPVSRATMRISQPQS